MKIFDVKVRICFEFINEKIIECISDLQLICVLLIFVYLTSIKKNKMKKIFIIPFFAFVFLTACSKEYICTCEITGTTKVEYYKLVNTKKKAVNNCNSLTNSAQTCVLEAY